MSFIQYKKYIELNDTVIAFVHPQCASAVLVKNEGALQNKYGRFEFEKMIGKEFGSKMASSNGKGFIYLLHPTPELWTSVLPHRTQILYMPDIALISTFLNLEPGVKILECGTGSGSFSHSVGRTIQPNGHLYSFEYHSDRALQANNDFKAHGLGNMVTVECRDVCKDGFGLKNVISAAFLDLPAPWEAIPHLIECFDKERIGRVCCYSPCVEQVQSTVKALSKHGFFDITMHEVLLRPYDVKKCPRDKWIKMPPVKNISRSHSNPMDIVDGTPVDIVVENERFETIQQDANGEDTQEIKSKKRQADDGGEQAKGKGREFIYVSRPTTEMRGHTSYLTFAKYVPLVL